MDKTLTSMGTWAKQWACESLQIYFESFKKKNKSNLNKNAQQCRHTKAINLIF